MRPLSVAVLCGGQSRRLGTDKALVSLAPDGPPLLAIVIDRVRTLADDLFLVGAARPGYELFGVPLVADRLPGLGPLAGIATALQYAKHPACLVVACDMPFLCRPLLAHMAAQDRAAYDVLVPAVPRDPATPNGPQVMQPLHAIYRRSCLPAITARLASDERRVTAFYDDVSIQIVAVEQVRRFDPNFRSFFSVNTPEALAEARRWHKRSSASH